VQGNIIQADLTDSFTLVDLDGDGTREHVAQVRDCLVVSAWRGGRWNVIALTQREVGRDIERVTLRPIAGERGVDVQHLRGTTRNNERFRWNGTELVAGP
jgi:hypothetical protein